MRLTHLKLAGFKSFVDTTTLHIHGQRVGVVGPNGCGKSNVMESVRWVLGESSAKEMRADAMDAVIFNGAANRKAVSRASVELIFDNSLGGATGAWSQYAEISVKRVIERDKGSTYYINNQVVRRRDVADLFLGTGLGGRAYAIIGQNTISRIVEAKPEELRIFLEEAAGVSKYKERRRETESRLRDTHENLMRVSDVLRELDKQVIKLEAQAMIAEQYHSLQKHLKQTQAQWMLLKKRDASVLWERSQRQVEKLVNDLEAQMTKLRHVELVLEQKRQNQYAAHEHLQASQAAYYEINAQVSNLEQQVRHTQEGRERLTLQLQQINIQLEKNRQQIQATEQDLIGVQRQKLEAETAQTQALEVLSVARTNLPTAQRAFQEANQSFDISVESLMDLEQATHIAQNNIQHQMQLLVDLQQRSEKLLQEMSQLVFLDEDLILNKDQQVAALQQTIQSIEHNLQSIIADDQTLQQQLHVDRDLAQGLHRQVSQIEAEIASLEKIQSSLGSEGQFADWLQEQNLEKSQRLWQRIKIESGWETALESVLGLRLNALIEGKIRNRPPSSLVVCYPNKTISSASSLSAKQSNLFSQIVDCPLEFSSMLFAWLGRVYIVENDAHIEQLRVNLQTDEILVNRDGDIFTQYSDTYYVAQSALHGVLERQQQIDTLKTRLPNLHVQLHQTQAHIVSGEQMVRQMAANLQQQQQTLRIEIQSQHQLQIELQRLRQTQQHVLSRQQIIIQEQSAIEQRLLGLQREVAHKKNDVAKSGAQLILLQEAKAKAFAHKTKIEHVFNQAREALQEAEKNAQEKMFNNKIINNNIKELYNKINVLHEEISLLNIRCKEAEAMLEATKMETLKSHLEIAVQTKQEKEQTLSKARNVVESGDLELQQHERNRMQAEQQLHPLRDQLEQGRLAEQQARLYFEQCQESLASLDVNEEMLIASLSEQAKVIDFERQVTQLQRETDALGPVNLAAISELNSERERKQYLDAQSLDLQQASATLEDAIKKIDRETRGRLQQTFDETNRNFNELFVTLFGGGQAKLELLGEEILDTGMHVFAQPPGKKNTSIQLLSGGEKALTAIALVFALFRLNPAPFCLMDEVDAPLDDSNTVRFCDMVRKMSERTQFLFVSHSKITMEMAQQLIGVTMQESGISRIVEVDVDAAVALQK